ncbi:MULTISPECIES: glutathione S-transferase [Vibrio]|uniref:glutathione transferase n=1 Tax=Vibrio mediterranei TaxID=689 RepID=A0A3G4VHS2_9VIBR|nr:MULTISPECIES: glutathione S-transferase [Vibrio]AYV23905.1 glutathione S-transferase [Vibrio mediterranei]NOH30273.1 glutathione S-transferase [Vibrio mediterranei]NUW74319.1 glutathione S-transferase [Vibrio mediterranei]
MIKLHHLNHSRSKRIIWLLEELGLDYEVVPYQRDSVTFLAPPELKSVHPLGKSPVIELDGQIITESGAITEYLIERFGADQLAPARQSLIYADYLTWLHFAESSAMLPLLLKVFLAKEPAETAFLSSYADIEQNKVLDYVNQQLEGKRYLIEDRLTGADIMMSFVVDVVTNLGVISQYANIQRYSEQLEKNPNYQKAIEIELQHNH